MDLVAVVVGVEKHADLEAVRRACEAVGLSDASPLAALHLVLGTIAADRIDALAKVAGVSSVERQRVIHLPPSGRPQ